jgi:hypothetical protein
VVGEDQGDLAGQIAGALAEDEIVEAGRVAGDEDGHAGDLVGVSARTSERAERLSQSSAKRASRALRVAEPPSAATAGRGGEAAEIDDEAHEEAGAALGERIGVVAGVDDVEAGAVEEAREAGDEAGLVGGGDEVDGGGALHDPPRLSTGGPPRANESSWTRRPRAARAAPFGPRSA